MSEGITVSLQHDVFECVLCVPSTLRKSFTYIFLCLCMFLLLFPTNTRASFYSSMVAVENLIRKDRVVVERLRKCLEDPKVEENKNLTERMQKYIEHSRLLIGNESSSTDTFLLHPINAYHLMKHTLLDWLYIEKYMEKPAAACLAELEVYRERSKFPGQDDIKFVAASIGRLQYMYELPIKEVIKGWIRINNRSKEAFQSRNPLNAKDVMVIGKSCRLVHYYKPAVQWLRAALDMIIDDNDTSTPYGESLSLLETAITALKEKTSLDAFDRIESLGALCQGDILKPVNLTSDLVCRYLTRNRGFLMIGPIKLEELSTDPPIMMFHDFLTDRETKRFIQTAAPMLQPSEVVHDNPDGEESFQRNSKQFWFRQHHGHRIHQKVTRRIEEVTGLNAGVNESETFHVAEPFQVLNYGVGGAYLYHPDYSSEVDRDIEWLDEGNNRIATFLIYLNDVHIGGATVFSEVDLVVWPKKGSAIFWYNLYKNGIGDENTEHASCPVVYGSKWISNKWIRLKGQTHYSCGISKDEKYSLLQ